MPIQAAMRLFRFAAGDRSARRRRDAPVDATEVLAGLARVGSWVVLSVLLLGLFVAQPVAAQSNPVCSDASNTLPSMIEGFIQLTTALGLMGLLVVWQADELAEMATIGQERKQKLKAHKWSAMKSAATLVMLGPVFTVAGDVMNLPVAQCVDLIPF